MQTDNKLKTPIKIKIDDALVSLPSHLTRTCNDILVMEMVDRKSSCMQSMHLFDGGGDGQKANMYLSD